MKIAIIGHKRIPSREGGVEVVVEELATRMAALGHEVIAYSRRGHNVAGKQYDRDRGFPKKPYMYKGVKVVPVKTIDAKGLAAMTSSIFATIKAIKEHPDVIHYHAEGPCAALFLAHIAGIRTVATIHGLDWRRAKWGRLASCYLKLGERIAVKYADEIIVLSKNMQQYFKLKYNRQTCYIPNGINKASQVSAKEIKSKYGLDKDEYILYLGRVVPEKGIEYLIDAFKTIDTDKKLVIAGGSSDSEEYFQQIKHKAQTDHRIIFTGFVEGRVLTELYSNSYVYVLPSDLEGMPMSLLEAMSYGNCCLVSDIPECREVVGDKAVLFNHGSVISLKNQLNALLLDSRKRLFYKNQSSEFITHKYSWDTIVKKTLILYCGKN